MTSMWMQQTDIDRGKGEPKIILSQSTTLSLVRKCTGFEVRILRYGLQHDLD